MKLSELLASESPTLTLNIQVIYGTPDQYTIKAYRQAGATLVSLEYDDMIRTTAPQFYAAMILAGWAMPQRPVRQSTLTFNYFLQRDAETDPTAGNFRLDSRASNDLDARRRDERMLQQFAEQIGAEYEQPGASKAIWHNQPGKERN